LVEQDFCAVPVFSGKKCDEVFYLNCFDVGTPKTLPRGLKRSLTNFLETTAPCADDVARFDGTVPMVPTYLYKNT